MIDSNFIEMVLLVSAGLVGLIGSSFEKWYISLPIYVGGFFICSLIITKLKEVTIREYNCARELRRKA